METEGGKGEWPWRVLEQLGVRAVSHQTVIATQLSKISGCGPLAAFDPAVAAPPIREGGNGARRTTSAAASSPDSGELSPTEARELRRLAAREHAVTAKAEQARQLQAKTEASEQQQQQHRHSEHPCPCAANLPPPPSALLFLKP